MPGDANWPCPTCGGPTIEGFTSRYCVRECDKRPMGNFQLPGQSDTTVEWSPATGTWKIVNKGGPAPVVLSGPSVASHPTSIWRHTVHATTGTLFPWKHSDLRHRDVVEMNDPAHGRHYYLVYLQDDKAPTGWTGGCMLSNDEVDNQLAQSYVQFALIKPGKDPELDQGLVHSLCFKYTNFYHMNAAAVYVNTGLSVP